MKIFKAIKRLWYRWRNSDPVHKCPVYKNEGCVLSMVFFVRFQIVTKFISTLGISLSDAYIANTIKNAVARIMGLVVMTENLIILANSFKSCKNLKEMERKFIYTKIIHIVSLKQKLL